MQNLIQKTLILGAAIVLLFSALSAEELSGLGGVFEDIGLGLRPLGMGGAYSAIAADENAARWNPALLDAVKDPVAGFTWTKQFNLIDYHYLSLAMPVGKNIGMKEDIGFGAYVISAGDDVLRETTIGLSVGVSAPRLHVPVESLRFGTTVKILMTSFGNNSDADGGEDRVTGDSFGFSVDLGLHWQAGEKLSFAVVSRELYNTISWNSSVAGSYQEGLPRVLVLAGAYKLKDVTFAAEYRPGLYGDVSDRIVLGGEAVFWGIIQPRFGFARDLRSRDSNQWVTAGLGMEFHPRQLGPLRVIHFGYTHLFHNIDSSPRVGLAIGW